jgi:hypothetical protein
MKVALMLTGLARKVQEGYAGYWKHIIDNNDVDLYLHAWESKSDGVTNHEDSDTVSKVYTNPKYLNIETPFKFTKYREGIDNPRNDKSRPLEDFDVYGNFRSFPMFYSWESTYKHILDSDINYDCVIRSRYDIGGSNLDLEKLDLTKINTSNHHWRNSDTYDDNLCVSNQENSNKIFSNIFTNIIEHHKKLGFINGAERNFTDYVKRVELNNISVKTNEIKFNLLRDNKVWF